jgi:hypothetical protein
MTCAILLTATARRGSLITRQYQTERSQPVADRS